MLARTVSMTWTTPLLASTSVRMILAVALPLVTVRPPSAMAKVSSLPEADTAEVRALSPVNRLEYATVPLLNKARGQQCD